MKQSLGQNFLRNESMVAPILAAFADTSDEACPSANVVEVRTGAVALSVMLWERFGDMSALELDNALSRAWRNCTRGYISSMGIC